MFRSSCLKQGQKYYLLRFKSQEAFRRVHPTIKRFRTRAINKKKLFYVSGAGAISCGAILYFTIRLHDFKDVTDALRIPLSADQVEEDVYDHLYEVGLEDEWLVFPFFPWGIMAKMQSQESNAFKKLSISEILSPWELSLSDDPWVLLQLTKSQNFWIRQMGVASLAGKIDWEAFKYRDIAQASDCQTIVGLARYPYANDAFFLQPPKLCESENDVIVDMQNLIKKMPLPETVNSSIYVYRTLALQKTIKFQNDPMTMDVLTQLYAIPGEEQKKEREKLIHCLQAFQAYTMDPKYAVSFTNLHGLALLQRVSEEYQEDKVQTYVHSILANLSQVPELVEPIVHTGWVYKLRKSSKGPSTSLSILALTILANLDRDWITDDIYQDMVLLHPTYRNSHPVYADVVLVHGLRGGAVKTWRQRDSENNGTNGAYSHCWPKDWLAEDFQGVRIISVGYNTSVHRWGDYGSFEHDKRTIDGRCQELMHKLHKAGVGSRPIIWLGHSLGGLLIKQILVSAKEDGRMECFLKQTQGIIMYSVPHKGSGLVDIMMHAKYLLFPSVEVQELMTSSPKLKHLHNKFLELMEGKAVPYLSFGENMKTDLGRPLPGTVIVPKESSDPGIGEFVSLEANHIDSCKPWGKTDPIYQNTRVFLQSVLNNLFNCQQ